MANMSLKKNEMPHQAPEVRARNFQEVALGYTPEQAIDEANRCLGCKNRSCVAGCPVNIDIPEFLSFVKEGDFEGAYNVISRQSSLPAVCGRVCPQETQCESKCVRGIKGEPVAIGRLERFVADYHNANCKDLPVRPESNGHKVAVIGSGPAGLTCAGDLAKKGYNVTIFEAFHVAGGVLVYGIPEFRLPKAIVAKEIETLKALGVDASIINEARDGNASLFGGDMLVTLLEARYRSMDKCATVEKKREKLLRFALGRGFGYGQAKEAVDKLFLVYLQID